MARKPVQEPFVNIVARKLGHAAGTLANFAHLRGKANGVSTESDSGSGKRGRDITGRGSEATKQQVTQQKASRGRSARPGASSRRSPRKKRAARAKPGRSRA